MIVEMARNPAHVTEALYPYEPSGIGKDAAGKAAREETVMRIVAKGSVTTAEARRWPGTGERARP